MIKIISYIVLSSLLILSSTGLSINMHYCHDELVDVAVSAPASSCCDDGDEDNCPSCHDKSIEIEPVSDFNISITAFDFNNDHSFELFLTDQSIAENLIIAETARSEMSNFEKPPLIKEVDLAQIQVFLI
ncbi:hypothetical protein ACFLRQ_01390 [Bacteroidota bacterium]